MRLEVFPASDGDCLLLSCGENPTNHILVDGGRRGAYELLKSRLDAIHSAGECIDLLVLSHIDADHIEGLLELIEDPERKVSIREVWYNGFDQLKTLESFGFKQGDRFSKGLKRSKLDVNASTGGKAIQILEVGLLPSIEIANGIKITILSPDRRRLDLLSAEWDIWHEASEALPSPPSSLEVMGRKPVGTIDIDSLADGKESVDGEIPNGSSIAFVAEHCGRRVLMGADAHPDLLAASIRRMLPAGEEKYRLDLLKVSHHGCKGNTTRDLACLLDCARYVISTDGTRHGHPDPEALAKLIKYGPKERKTFYFNYRSSKTKPWDAPEICQKWNYSCVFPPHEGEPLVVIV